MARSPFANDTASSRHSHPLNAGSSGLIREAADGTPEREKRHVERSWSKVVGRTRRGPVVLDSEVFATWGSAARAGGNDLETVVFGRRPDVRALFEKVTLTQPLLCRMAGSGAAVFGVYRDERARDDAALQLGTRDWTLIETASGKGEGNPVRSPS